MISENQAINLLKKYDLDNTVINHCIGVGNIAYDLSNKIKTKNNNLEINPNKLKIAGLLHDIGKSKKGIHELNTIDILKKENLNDIADISAHGFLYEYFLEKNKNIANNYLPKTIENKILVLSDMYYNQNQEKVTIDERFNDIFKRHSNDLNFIKILNKAKSRIIKLEKEILRLL